MQQGKTASAAASSASTGSKKGPRAQHTKSKQSAVASTEPDASKKTQGKPGRPAGRMKAAAAKSADMDAIALLKNDHRTVEQLFKAYEEAQATSAKSELARQISMELIIHAHLEEQIFYPACREKGVEDDALDEAQVEHDGAKVMIADILEGSPDDHYYDAKVKVLKEYIKHHVNEEEKSDGIFAKARQASVDLSELGTQLKSMKDQLTAEGDAVAAAPLETPSLQLNHINAMSEETQMPRQSNYDDEDDFRSSRGRGGNNRSRDDEGRFMSDDDDRGGRGRSSRSSYDDEDDNRSRSSRGRNMDRDDQGRFMSDDDDDDRSGRGRSSGGRGHGGWFGDSEGHAEAARQRGSSSRSSRSSYDDDEDDSRSSRGREENNRMRDDDGRFASDDDDNRGGRSRSSRSNNDDDDDDHSSRGRGGGGRGHGGWFGDTEGHSRAAMQRQQSQSSGQDDEDRGGRSRGRSQSGRSQSSRNQGGRSQSGGGRHDGHGGWFGDSEGHSQAARRGWRDRD